jgi:hypothetical protein
MSYDRAERMTRIRAVKGAQMLTNFDYSYTKRGGESNLRQHVIDRVADRKKRWS